MEVTVLLEAGYEQALRGLARSYNQSPDKMPEVAKGCCLLGGSHAKFMESMMVWMDVSAPRYWWQQFDTYRVGVTKQSNSTMHTIMRGELTQGNFESAIPYCILDTLNVYIRGRDFTEVKNALPEGFLQGRTVCINYKALAHIYRQRWTHKLPQWKMFLTSTLEQLKYPKFITMYGANQRHVEWGEEEE